MKAFTPHRRDPAKYHATIFVPPTAPLNRPQLEAHILQACARRAGYRVKVVYLNLMVATQFGVEFQKNLSSGQPHREEMRSVFEQTSDALQASQTPLAVYSHGQTWDPFTKILKTIKDRNPQMVTLVCNGTNSDPVKRLESEAYIDHLLTGENEASFTMFLTLFVSGHPPTLRHFYGHQKTDLDRLPTPDFSEYFEQLESHLPHFDEDLWLPYECSRQVREHTNLKSPNRITKDLERYAHQYTCRRIYMQDHQLSLFHFETLVPKLAAGHPEFQISFALNKVPQMRTLLTFKAAGIWNLRLPDTYGQALFQSDASNLVALINLLRHVSAANLDLIWSLPDHTLFSEQEQEQLLERIRLMRHLPPPDRLRSSSQDAFAKHLNKEIKVWRTAYFADDAPDISLEAAEELVVIKDNRRLPGIRSNWILDAAEAQSVMMSQAYKEQSLLTEALECKAALLVDDIYVPLIHAEVGYFLELEQHRDPNFETNPVI